MTHRSPLFPLVLGALLVGGGCGPSPQPDPAESDTDSPPSNRVELPALARRTLGISFATAEYRAVTGTITLPGHFELLPSAQHHYPLPASGRVTVHVAPLDTVRTGQLLLSIDAPAWRELQGDLLGAHAAWLQAEARLTRARAARQAAGSLAQPGDGIDVYAADISAAQADLHVAAQRHQQVIAQAAALTGLSAEQLDAVEDGVPHWQRLGAIPIRAVDAGVVREVDAATGTWVADGTEVVHVVHLQSLRFRGKALQADLIDHLRDGQRAHILPPEGNHAARRAAGIDGRIRLGVTGDPDTRTVDVFVDLAAETPAAWVRPQVAALAEVVIAGDPDAKELAIPQRAVVQDGLEKVFFRRDPEDPDAVIRTPADLGPSNGRWVTVYSGLVEGHEVVVDGVYQLKLATSAQKSKAGHYHADGTWHESEH